MSTSASSRRAPTTTAASPRPGPIDRILASHSETGPGRRLRRVSACTCRSADDCTGPSTRASLQPYAIYVPKQAAAGPRLRADAAAALAVDATTTSSRQPQPVASSASAGPGSIVLTPEARGPDGIYDGLSPRPTCSRRGPTSPATTSLDPDWTAIAGYSMGGFGTFKLAEQFPDLFARGAARRWATELDTDMLGSLRNIPVLMWNSAADELVPIPGLPADGRAARLARLPLRARRVRARASTTRSRINDQFGPAAAFLAPNGRSRPGARDLRRRPGARLCQAGFVGRPRLLALGRARARRRTGTPAKWRTRRAIDVLSRGFGAGDPAPGPTQAGSRHADRRQPPARYAVHAPVQELGPAPAAPGRTCST